MGYTEILQLRQSLIKDYTFKAQRKLLTAASVSASATVLDHKVGETCILLPTWFLGIALPLKSIETAQHIRINTIRFVPGSVHWNFTGPSQSLHLHSESKGNLLSGTRQSEKVMEVLSSERSLTRLGHLIALALDPSQADEKAQLGGTVSTEARGERLGGASGPWSILCAQVLGLGFQPFSPKHLIIA